MEILKPAYSTETKNAGTATYPDIIKVATNTPGRAIDSSIQVLKIQRSYNFYLLKNLVHETESDVAAKYHINGGDLNETPTNIFLPDLEKKHIRIPSEDRNYDPTTGRLLPKEASIGIVAQSTHSDTLPSPGNLARLLIEDSNYDAATAAFFLSKDILHATFRTNNTPQLNKTGVQNAIKELENELKEENPSSSALMKEAKAKILNKAIKKYNLKHFSGQLNRLTLHEGILI